MPFSYHSLVAESRTVPYRVAESSLTLLVPFSYPPKSPLSLFLKTGALPRCFPFLVSLTALICSSPFRFADLLRPLLQIPPGTANSREVPCPAATSSRDLPPSTTFYPLPPTGYSTTHSSQHPRFLGLRSAPRSAPDLVFHRIGAPTEGFMSPLLTTTRNS